MFKWYIPFCLLIIYGLSAQKVSHGSLELYPLFPSSFVASRTVAVWLPENYDPQENYPVLYMHDGQMLFDANTTWNKLEWGLDEVAHREITAGNIRPFIGVGIWNGGALRHAEYIPQKALELLSENQRDSIIKHSTRGGYPLFQTPLQADAYLKFLTQEVKPFIDQKYPTLADAEHTFIMGSSMGGLISWYALCEYPQIFGGAACLSTHWPGGFVYEKNPIPGAFLAYLNQNLPPPKNHRLYFDLGDATLDAHYPDLQEEVNKLLSKKGFAEPYWKTLFFPGEEHSEIAWNKRLHEPLNFLLSN